MIAKSMGRLRRMLTGRIPLASALVAAALLGMAAPALAQDRTPRLLEGKTTLYERVLTRPEAVLRSAPGDGATLVLDPVPPFTVYYVYDEREADGAAWLEVGVGRDGAVDGWVRQDRTVRWDSNMTVAFANPANRDRVLLFADRDSLTDTLNADNPAAAASALRQAVQEGTQPESVVSIEPDVYVDLRRQFYLLPILDSEEIYLDSGFTSRLLQVASVTLPKARGQAADPAREDLLVDFRAGVVFVIDTTTSMGPYIDRTRDAIRAVYEKLEDDGLLGKVAFGLVAFRDSTDAVPGLDYVARVYADLDQGSDPIEFFDQVTTVAPATLSSQGFVEDAFSGVVQAIESMPWESFGGRYVVLITDAGSRRGNDPLSGTRMDSEQVRQLALDRGVAIYTLHLLTDTGRENHEDAAAQYTVLSSFPGLARPLYYPVGAGDVNQFGEVVDALGDALADQVADAANHFDAPEPPPVTNTDDPLERIDADALIVGNAMMLAYLGREEGAEAPSVIEAWAADRDIGDPTVAALDVRVLLTKTQLSDLQEVLKAIVDAARVGQMAPESFFDELQSAALALSRDPTTVGGSEARNLAELGLIGEYLDGLPYQSKIMGIDQDLWLSWSVGEQQAFIDEIEAKIRLYEAYHNNVDRWIALDGGRVPGDAVYPIPLDALP
ncbi:MAG: vWA domain-containing protein [Alphaproteobacteria bacterium]